MIDNGDHSRIEKWADKGKAIYMYIWYHNGGPFSEYPETHPMPQTAHTPAAQELLMVKLFLSDPELDKFKHRLVPMMTQINKMKQS